MSQQLSLQSLDREKIELLKTTICKGATDDELKLFCHACNHLQLDPFIKQIHAIKRWDSQAKKEVMSIQVGIGGLRLIADRTGKYAPGPEPTFVFDSNGGLISATAYVKKQTQDGTWHTVSATAFYAEYCQRNKEGNPVAMWRTMPCGQTAKCAEAQALYKAFPAETSGAHIEEEMQQADNAVVTDPLISPEQAAELEMYLYDDAEGLTKLLAWAQVPALDQVRISRFQSILAACKRRAKTKAEEEQKLIEVKSEVP